jgi:P4 family phage/plasmid primase-like protien
MFAHSIRRQLEGGNLMALNLNEWCKSYGLYEDPVLDGSFHEVKSDSFKGWYVGSKDTTSKGTEFIKFSLGDWRSGEKYFFIDSPPVDKNEQKEIKRKSDQADKEARQKRDALEKEVSVRAAKEFFDFKDTGKVSPYMEKKGFENNLGAKSVKNSFGLIDLVIPMKDNEGKIWGYQTIEETGEKGFVSQQRIEGCFFQFGKLDGGIVFITEGFATGASVFSATNKPTVVAFNTANLESVGVSIRKVQPKAKIIFCADDDQFKNKNYGRIKAIAAAQRCKGQVIFPKFADLETKPTDFNDLHKLEGLEKVTEQIMGSKFVEPEEIIPTELTGFHSLSFSRGEEIYTPEIDDLVKYFNRETKFKVLGNSKRCHTFNGQYYEEIGDSWIEHFAETNFKPKPDNRTVSEFLKKVLRTNLVPENWFGDSTHGKVNFLNGVLDTDTETILPHNDRYGFRYVLPYAFDPKAEAPKFEKFLDDIMMGDNDLKQLLLEFSGYCLSGDECWLQKALILEGGGQNGKSTFINVIRDVIGNKNTSPLTLSALNTETSRVMLDGKLANFAEETPNRKMLDSSTFKNLVSGGEIQMRALYKQAYTVRNRAKLVFACNELPDSGDTTHGYFRRLIIVPFEAEFSSERGNLDPFIEKKLSEELAGIFNLCFRAYKQTKKRGKFLEPQKTVETKRQYMLDIDPIETWADRFLDVHPLGNGHDDNLLPLPKAYQEFAIWIEQNGMKPISSIWFTRKLRKSIPKFKERYTVTKGKDRKSYRALRAILLNKDVE